MEYSLPIWGLIASSAVIAAIVSAIASFIINLLSQNRGYKQDYYKIIISKRVETYQYIEAQLEVMKFTIVDTTGQGYYMMFSSPYDKYNDYQNNLRLALANSLWLSEQMLDALTRLNQMFLAIDAEMNNDIDNNIRVGKKYYQELADIRILVENNLKSDLSKLYKVHTFLKHKTKNKQILYNISKHHKMSEQKT